MGHFHTVHNLETGEVTEVPFTEEEELAWQEAAEAAENIDRQNFNRNISRRQFFQGLAKMDQISKQEAIDAAGSGIIPPAMSLLISGLPDEDDQFDAMMLLASAQEFNRDHQLTGVFGMAYGWTEDQIDDFWRFAGKL